MRKLFFVFTMVFIITTSCNEKIPEFITGEVWSFETTILSDSISVASFSIADKDGRDWKVTVDLADSLNHKVLDQMISMVKYHYYQPVIVRFQKQKNDYRVIEQAVLHYDVSGTPPVYVFMSDLEYYGF